jgi:uncharacterized protein YdeI (YjbR/CyaY-like superfamily)
MGGGAVLGVQKAIMAEAAVSVGTRSPSSSARRGPREVEEPDHLAKALARNDPARAAFEGLSFSRKREYVRSITEAKRAQTRARRIGLTIERLVERASGGPG